MLDAIEYTCANCAHKFDSVDSPRNCPNCHAMGGTRDFPMSKSLVIAGQNDRFRRATGVIAQLISGESLAEMVGSSTKDLFSLSPIEVSGNLKGSLVITRAVAGCRIDFVRKAITACAVDSDFSDFNDPHAEHDFGTVEINGDNLFWKIDLYDNDLEFGSSNPADPSATHRVLTIMFPSDY